MQINTAAQQPTHRNTDTQSLFRHAGQRTQATNTEQRDHYATPQVNGIFERNKQESYRTTSLTNSYPRARASSTNQNEPPPASSPLGDSLVGRAIWFNWGGQIGWCDGRVFSTSTRADLDEEELEELEELECARRC